MGSPPGLKVPPVMRKAISMPLITRGNTQLEKSPRLENASVFVELPSGSVGNGIRFNSEGDMFIADYTNHNVLKVDMETRNIFAHAHEPRMSQPNDLAIGANDIIYASDPNWSESTGQLWRIGTDGEVTLLEAEMGTTNGIEVSPDERTLFVNESAQLNVWAYDLSTKGEISNKRLLIEFPDFNMDGMRCDITGNLYVTRHGKGTVAKISPDGELLLEVQLTGKLCTNIAFGGPRWSYLLCDVGGPGERGNLPRR